MRKYWCYRIDTSAISFFWKELGEGRLRQGWGWDERQNLKNMQMDEGARRNKPMLEKVKKGDILLIPQLPKWGSVAIVEATEDWSEGYKFSIDKTIGDYGHIFPAKFLKSFTRNNSHVTGNIRLTLRNPSRFWNINRYSEDVQKLLNTDQSELEEPQDYESRLSGAVGDVFSEVFKEKDFNDGLYTKMNEQFQSGEWEYALVAGLREIFPFYEIERVGGKKEKNHGTDILIKLPGLTNDYQYAIAIQVKDYAGLVSSEVIQQIKKADDYWEEKESLKLIDRWIIITKAEKDENVVLNDNDENIRIMFARELKDLLSRIGMKMIWKKESLK